LTSSEGEVVAEHDHDGGLRADLPLLLDRRRALLLVGGAGLATLVGCGSGSGNDKAASTTTTAGSGSSTSAAASPSGGCSTIPEETAGPFPGDGSNGPDVLTEAGVVRSDITSSFGSAGGKAVGVPLTIKLSLVDSTGSCKALTGAAVYVWHCDRAGRYSLYSSGVTGENYLRGLQQADDNGQVTFESIFPACYAGRWPHIHFEVYKSLGDATSGGTRVATSQVAMPEPWCTKVFATPGYEQSVTNLRQVTLVRDNVFGDDGGIHQLGTVTGSVDGGLTVTLTVPVNPSHTSSGSPAGGTDGAPPGAPPGGQQ
jgi:protocatechuate 3,4-dioxygenase beta subunit